MTATTTRRRPRRSFSLSHSSAPRSASRTPSRRRRRQKTSNRKGPLHQAAVAAIREWLTDGWPAYVGRQPGPEDYLFPRPDGQPSRPKSARELRGDLERAGLPTQLDGRPFEFKDFRATFATALEEAGVGEKIIKRLMGHKPVGVTETHYTRRGLRTMEAAVALIELEWEGGLPPFRAVSDDAHEAALRPRSDRCGRGTMGMLPGPSAVGPKLHCAAYSASLHCDGRFLNDYSAPGAGRTHDLRFRKPLLYPLSYGGKLLETVGVSGTF